MSVYKVPDATVKEGLRITNKAGMTVQTYKLESISSTLTKFSNTSLDAFTAGLYLSDRTPGTKWYKVTSKSRGDMFIEDKELGKCMVYLNDPSGVSDELGRKWKTGDDVYSWGANVRKGASTTAEIWKSAYIGLVGKFVSLTKTSSGSWIKTDTNLYIFASLANKTAMVIGTQPQKENTDTNTTVPNTASKLSSFNPAILLLALGAILVATSFND